MRTIVYKVGGSLLSLPDLASRLHELFAQNVDSRPLLVAGGGPAANLVREWDRVHDLGQERSHRLALQAMRLNEAFLQELLPDARIVAERQQAEAFWREGQTPILCADKFLKSQEPDSPLKLPHTWDVTSDSIAAWIALHWPADGLVLLKSVPLPEDTRGTTAVDPHFIQIVRDLPDVGWVNLRVDGLMKRFEL